MIKYEKERMGENYFFEIQFREQFSFISHFHQCFEIAFVEKGEIKITVNNNENILNEGEMIVILPNEIHAYDTPEKSKIVICIFSPQYVNHFYVEMINKQFDNSVLNLNKIEQLIKSFLYQTETDIYEKKAILYLICSEMLKQKKVLPITKEKKQSYEIIAFIMEHFTENITLKTIAQKFNYEYRYLSKKINRFLDMNFSQFLNRQRVEYATYLLKNTEKKISEIAYLCGFESLRSFNRNFFNVMKKTPREYSKINSN